MDLYSENWFHVLLFFFFLVYNLLHIPTYLNIEYLYIHIMIIQFENIKKLGAHF